MLVHLASKESAFKSPGMLATSVNNLISQSISKHKSGIMWLSRYTGKEVGDLDDW